MLRLLTLLGCAIAHCSPSSAQVASQPPQAPSEAHLAWQRLTSTDLAAAYALIRDNHPGAAPELRDQDFQRRLEDGHALAQSRIGRVQGFNGYRAVLLGFANTFGDKHIWSLPLVRRPYLPFPGIVTAMRGSEWVVAEDLESGAEQPLTGARLISCDGVEADELARQRLGGFRAVWSIEAQRIARAPWLLVDDNPLLARPQVCIFDRQGTRIEHRLRWRNMDGAALGARLDAAAPTGAPGHALRQFDGGWWIGVQDFTTRAAAVAAEVESKAAEIRRARMVVLDLRGNGGGNSAYANQLASAIYGPAHVQRILDPGGARDCPAAWRATTDNLAALDRFLEQSGAAGAGFVPERDALQAALSRGEPFSSSVACGRSSREEPAPPRIAPPAGTPRVILLTDHACFSSCLIATGLFRRLGALHVGEATDAGTRYMEVREISLPSGLSTFSTLQKVMLSGSGDVGPFVPDRRYEGNISDTAALERWIAQLAAS